MAKLNPKKKYAQIQTGKVHAIFMGSDLPEYNDKDLTIIEAKDDYKLGDAYENGKVIPQVKTVSLADVKEEKKAELLEKRMDHLFKSTAQYKGHTFQMAIDSYNRLTAIASLAALNGELPPDFFWVDVDNKRVPMTLAEFKEFTKFFVKTYWEAFSRYQGLREKVAAAQSPAEVNKVVW